MTDFITTTYNLTINTLIVGRVTPTNYLGDAASASPLNTAGISVRTIPIAPPSIPIKGS